MGKFVKRTVTALTAVPLLYLVLQSDFHWVLLVPVLLLTAYECHTKIVRPMLEAHTLVQLIYPTIWVLLFALLHAWRASSGQPHELATDVCVSVVLYFLYTLLFQVCSR